MRPNIIRVVDAGRDEFVIVSHDFRAFFCSVAFFLCKPFRRYSKMVSKELDYLMVNRSFV